MCMSHVMSLSKHWKHCFRFGYNITIVLQWCCITARLHDKRWTSSHWLRRQAVVTSMLVTNIINLVHFSSKTVLDVYQNILYNIHIKCNHVLTVYLFVPRQTYEVGCKHWSIKSSQIPRCKVSLNQHCTYTMAWPKNWIYRYKYFSTFYDIKSIFYIALWNVNGNHRYDFSALNVHHIHNQEKIFPFYKNTTKPVLNLYKIKI